MPDKTPALEEVIFTAQKRGLESLQDVAMSAAVISSELIDLKQLVGMDDFLRTIPSVAFQEYGAGKSTIIIRGIYPPIHGIYRIQSPFSTGLLNVLTS